MLYIVPYAHPITNLSVRCRKLIVDIASALVILIFDISSLSTRGKSRDQGSPPAHLK